MKKTKRNFLLVTIIIFLTVSTSCKSNEISAITKKIESQRKPILANNNETNKFSNIQDLKALKENININFEGRSLKLKASIYNDKNRLYLPLSELIEKLDGKIEYNNVINISINNKNISINSKDKKYWFAVNPNVKFNLKKEIMKSELLPFYWTKYYNCL